MNTIPRTGTRVWHATVLRAHGFPLAPGERCRFVARVGHDAGGALDLLFHGDCGAIEVFAPSDEDLGTGARTVSGLRGCTLTPVTNDGGARRERVNCPPRRGPPRSSSHDLTIDGTTAHAYRQWDPPASLDLAWDPESEPIEP